MKEQNENVVRKILSSTKCSLNTSPCYSSYAIKEINEKNLEDRDTPRIWNSTIYKDIIGLPLNPAIPFWAVTRAEKL